MWKQGMIQPVRSVFEYQTQCHNLVKFGNLFFFFFFFLALLLWYFQLAPGFLSIKISIFNVIFSRICR